MSKLENIEVSIEQGHTPSQLPAILSELQFKLQQLIDTGTSDSIDLRSLPLFPGDYEQLKQHLGHGEIHVSIDAMGPSEIYETTIPGIWWVSHFNNQDENIAEYIEVTPLPELLKSNHQDIQQGEQQLQLLIDQYIHNLQSEQGEGDEAK